MGMMVVLFTISVIPARAWEPQPWMKYIIQLELEKDTVPQPSIMTKGFRTSKKVDTRPFNCGPYFFYQPGIFEAEDEQRQNEKVARGDYTTGDFVLDIITDILDIFTK